MESEDEFDIRTYLTILRKNIWLITLITVFCTATATIISFLQPKVYEASSQIELSQQQDSVTTGAVLSDPNAFQAQINTQARIVKSPSVQTLAKATLGNSGRDVLSISAKGVTSTRILTISAQSKKPEVARDAANAYTDAYLRVRSDSALQNIQGISEAVQRKQAELQKSIDSLRATYQGKETPADAGTKLAEYEAQMKQLQTQYNQVQAQAIVRQSGSNLIALADLPSTPVSPKPLRNGMLALVLGLLLGVGAALLRARFGDKFDNEAELERAFPKVAKLGVLPHVTTWPQGGEHASVASLDLHSAAAEAYRRLRTNIEFVGLERDLKCLEIVSSVEKEGKSTTVAHLATVLAWSGKNVVVVDADLRRPSIHELFELPNDRGFTSALVNGTSIEQVIHTVAIPGGGTVSVIPSGPTPPNPVELLENNRVATFMTELHERFDFVLVDSPPVIPVADPLVLSRYADGLLLVVRAGETTKSQIEKSMSMIEMSSRAPLLGIVLNSVEEHAMYDKYGYSSYSSQPAKSK